MKAELGVLASRIPPPDSRKPRGEDWEFMNGSMSVLTTGLPKDMGGHKKSQAEFAIHNKRVGDALMNLEEGRDEDDIRPPYVYQPYPKMLFHHEKGEFIVANKDEQKVKESEGWRTTPYEKPRVVVLDPAIEKKALIDENRELKGQIVHQTDLLSRLEARLESLEKKK